MEQFPSGIILDPELHFSRFYQPGEGPRPIKQNDEHVYPLDYLVEYQDGKAIKKAEGLNIQLPGGLAELSEIQAKFVEVLVVK